MLNTTLKRSRFYPITDLRYEVRLAATREEIESALRLRFDVFNVELAHRETTNNVVNLEFDEYDAKCKHLIIVEQSSGKTIGTYRLNTIETAATVHGFYSFEEFCLENLPFDILADGIEIGRACIAHDHRNTRALFLLWRGLARYLTLLKKRYFFGCCSIFTNDRVIGERAFQRLKRNDHFHPHIFIEPRKNSIPLPPIPQVSVVIKLPILFEMYLKIGAKFCSPPMVDTGFGTIDFFVILDVLKMNPKYREIFFGATI